MIFSRRPPLMVEVFCTTVNEEAEAEMLLAEIKFRFPECKVNFDLEDCDKILRVASSHKIEMATIEKMVQSRGYSISVLSDKVKTISDIIL